MKPDRTGTLVRHQWAALECYRKGEPYRLPPTEWEELREAVCDALERREGHRIPYCADIGEPNFLFLLVPVCILHFYI